MKHVLQITTFMVAIAGPTSLTIARAMQYEGPGTIPEEQPTVMVEQSGGDIQRHVDAIEHAPDPSTAVAAYAAAKSVLPDSSKIDQAYLRRMVDFGLPQMADAQARTLVQHDPKDGLAWGVIAFSLATRGQTAEALKDIASATRYLPDDPFIQRTAGQLLAWYDTVADKSTLTESIKNSVEVVRNRMSAQRAYANAYQAARSAYEQGANPAETGPASAEANPEEALPEPMYGGGGYAYNNDYGYDYGPGYTYAYGYPGYYAGYPDYFPYGGGFYGGGWWPGPFSSVIVPGGDFFFRDRFFHHEPDLDDFIGFPGQRFFHHRFADRDDFFRHRFFDRDDFFRHRSFDRDHRVFGRNFGGFDRRHGFVTRSPQFNRGFSGFATRSPQFNRGFTPRFAPRTNATTRTPQHFAPAPHMSRGPQFTRSAPRMAASPRFAAGPRFSGGSGRMGGGGGRARR